MTALTKRWRLKMQKWLARQQRPRSRLLLLLLPLPLRLRLLLLRRRVRLPHRLLPLRLLLLRLLPRQLHCRLIPGQCCGVVDAAAA